MASSIPSSWHTRPAQLLQQLLRFNTTNPPGNERECIQFVEQLLNEAGVQTTIKAELPDRPNLIARLPGRGDAPPLLLYGHVDVVGTGNQDWLHDPFAGTIADGFVWGRGALDMKGGVAMMLSALLRAKAEGFVPPGDVILAVLSDEEAGGRHGAKYLVENHSDLFQGIRYAIGEFGGFSLPIAGRRFYPIMVAEKQICWMRAHVRGIGGHGAMPVRGQTLARLAGLVTRLDRHRLPVHITPVAKTMLRRISANLPFPAGFVFRQLANPRLTNLILDVLGEKGRPFDAILHNTVSATTVRAGDETVTNVIPSEAWVALDGRILPGFGKDDLIREIHNVTGRDFELETVLCEPGTSQLDMGLFGLLEAVLQECDPEGIPIPLLLSGSTDGRWFSRLGIQTYGYLPTPLPSNFFFTLTIHAANERIPVEAVQFGADAIYKVLQRFGLGSAQA